MIIPEGSEERDHQGRRITWGRVATRWTEWFVSLRVGRWRYFIAWCPHYHYVRTRRWQARGWVRMGDDTWRKADE